MKLPLDTYSLSSIIIQVILNRFTSRMQAGKGSGITLASSSGYLYIYIYIHMYVFVHVSGWDSMNLDVNLQDTCCFRYCYWHTHTTNKTHLYTSTQVHACRTGFPKGNYVQMFALRKGAPEGNRYLDCVQSPAQTQMIHNTHLYCFVRVDEHIYIYIYNVIYMHFYVFAVHRMNDDSHISIFKHKHVSHVHTPWQCAALACAHRTGVEATGLVGRM